jgi:hypothetical protein
MRLQPLKPLQPLQYSLNLQYSESEVLPESEEEAAE